MNAYEKQVYTGLSGKVLGVYWGRSYEGMERAEIERRWGVIDRYVHEDRNAPLIVADDDIAGTLTFIRALADSGRYADTPADFFGKTWLNYLMEHQTILWWGGMSHSTEHTALMRLKQGIPSPESGSMARNGRRVAEQIGGQIFIDAFGLVAPGRPELAAELAEKSARVSHDGEAVWAARVVAAMVAGAFEEKDMDRLLDLGVSMIPPDSIIARIHRDVRAWAATDGDWRRTFARIAETYGYRRYGGNCHVFPNHAIMVMAWAYGRDDFYETMKIVGSAGWDTDCNAGNVGSVTALAAGLENIDRRYEFRAPVADRVLIPTADGTDASADLLRLALDLAAIGRKVMGWPAVTPPKAGAWHHFSQPGALHGYLPDDTEFAGRRRAEATYAEIAGDVPGEAPVGGLSFCFRTGPGCFARILTPAAPPASTSQHTHIGTPYLYPGMTLRADGRALELSAPATLRMTVRVERPGAERPEWMVSDPVRLEAGTPFSWSWRLSPGTEAVVREFGFLAEAETPVRGKVFIDRVECGGEARVTLAWSPSFSARGIPGWISNLDGIRDSFSDEPPGLLHLVKNGGEGILVTGNRRWTDTTLSCGFNIHAAARAGFVLRHQGLRRGYLLVFGRGKASIVRRHYGDTVLAETPFTYPEDELLPVTVSAKGKRLTLSVSGDVLVKVEDETFFGGGVGFCVEEGLCGFRDCVIDISRA